MRLFSELSALGLLWWGEDAIDGRWRLCHFNYSWYPTQRASRPAPAQQGSGWGEPWMRMLGRSVTVGMTPAVRSGGERSGTGHCCHPRAHMALVAASRACTPLAEGWRGGSQLGWSKICGNSGFQIMKYRWGLKKNVYEKAHLIDCVLCFLAYTAMVTAPIGCFGTIQVLKNEQIDKVLQNSRNHCTGVF